MSAWGILRVRGARKASFVDPAHVVHGPERIGLTGKRSLLERVELMEGVQSAGLGRPAGPRALRRAFDLPILAADHRTTQGRGGVGPEAGARRRKGGGEAVKVMLTGLACRWIEI